ncbi:branched-chain amino acid transport system permease protein [Micromonospora phaseoli]|uniref:Branched-chain amino acid transport system permease protein n=1 Tax=Micromonospora phaseoli TaxID=1144548 RepID=A0A1H6UJP5_9ACTN|nr:branched-chain amino acid ABC transporter permease [Micromonospora phaseoli]PZV99044.1 branched-chain amino acid transport system permease protein [Micromonospora phaseoli]GIJ76202.1 branched-chain amino acid ABC transporter permease [Micromonospora phaseoli]SEI92543.1 branched-chain amino acid transport system permease protein [Micromonospora phaseoli]
MSATRAVAPPARHAAEPVRPGRSVPTVLRHLAFATGAALVVLVLSYQLDSFRNFQLATVAAYLCATAGLTVLTGLCGQLSLGHGALMATGAYTLALVQNAFAERGLTAGGLLILSLAVAVLATVVVGAVVGVAAARLRGPYLAGLTLAVAVVVPALTVTFNGVFNGEQGLSVPMAPAPRALGPYFPYERWQLWTAAVATLLCLVLLANLVRSRYGRAFRAVRDDEVAARLAGIHVARTQVIAFVVSAASAGLGGALLAVLAQSVSPGAFGLTLSLFLLMAVVIGGLGRLAGAVWGAFLLVALPDLTHSLTSLFTLSPAAAQRLEGNLPLAIFGVTLIVVMIAAPGGVQGLLSRLTGTLRVRWRHHRS